MNIEFLLPRIAGKLVTIDGYLVPNIEVHDNENTLEIILDGRFSLTVKDMDAAKDFIWLLANAQAIAAGYSCHGENCNSLNPHKVKAMQICGDFPSKPPLTLIKNDN